MTDNPFRDMDRDAILAAAWKALAANPDVVNNGFPRGFWPDLAAVAVEMCLQRTLDPVLNFRPTRSGDVFMYKDKKPLERLSKQQKEFKIIEPKSDYSFNPFARIVDRK